MEKIYSEHQKRIGFDKVCPKTINFLISFSQALYETKHKGMRFETFLN